MANAVCITENGLFPDIKEILSRSLVFEKDFLMSLSMDFMGKDLEKSVGRTSEVIIEGRNKCKVKVFWMSKLLLLGAPEGLSITVDFNSWTTGPLFKGIKNIPSGIHYITTNLDQVFGRSGFFIDASKDLNIWQWNDAFNRFDQVFDQDQLSRIKLGIHEIELGLGPYPSDLYESWQLHSNYLNWNLLQKICPGNSTDTVTSSSQLSDVADPRLESKSHTIHFTAIDLKHSFPDDIHGELRSKYAMDKSWLLSKLISENSAQDILGELQLSFLLFILGQFYDGFEQWKILVHLVCNSEQSLEEDPSFFVEFLCTYNLQSDSRCPYEPVERMSGRLFP